jgi:Uma2 family endonuclease
MMNTVLTEEVMSTITPKRERAPAVLYDIDWDTYTRFLRAFRGQRLRHTYDRGVLEIMTPMLWEHEEPSFLLGHLVGVLAEELDLPLRAGGSLILRRRKKLRGLEPDKCFWIASAPQLQGKTKLDLRVDPPPDLAMEVDVTSSSVDRMSVYAALGVPELWRLSRGKLTFHALRGKKKYQVCAKSPAFPALEAADLLPFIKQLGPSDIIAIVRQFRKWVRRDLIKRMEK